MVSSPAPTSASAPSRSVSGAALEPDQLDLVRLVGQLDARVVVVGHPAGEPLVVLDDLAHPGLDLGEVVRGERNLDVEVVVEAVLDRRADPELGVRVEVLHGLGQHVGARVPQDVVPVVAVDRDALDLVAVGELVGEVLQRATNPSCHDVRLVLEELPGLGARSDGERGRLLSLARGGGDEDDLDVGHRNLFGAGGPVGRGRGAVRSMVSTGRGRDARELVSVHCRVRGGRA